MSKAKKILVSRVDDGGPAFPVSIDDFRDKETHPMPGMTLRDLFAGMALQGIIITNANVTFEDDTRQAYMYADAMIEERNK